MTNLSIAGYKFTSLTELTLLRDTLFNKCKDLLLIGTILLSAEGININLAGNEKAISAFRTYLAANERFVDVPFHITQTDKAPFKRLKVKLKKEIITFNQATSPLNHRAPALSPQVLKAWLDEGRDITLLDTRNDYEVAHGTFKDAVNLHLAHFSDLPKALTSLDTQKPVVTFCTGGIRCEKAALYMQTQGFDEVYQLDGGILGYFATVGGVHYEGNCFVFDERIAVDSALSPAP